MTKCWAEGTDSLWPGASVVSPAGSAVTRKSPSGPCRLVHIKTERERENKAHECQQRTANKNRPPPEEEGSQSCCCELHCAQKRNNDRWQAGAFGPAAHEGTGEVAIVARGNSERQSSGTGQTCLYVFACVFMAPTVLHTLLSLLPLLVPQLAALLSAAVSGR